MVKITTHKPNTEEHNKLEFVCDKLNILATFNRENRFYTVTDVYFDFGQDWMWTTIVCDYTTVLEDGRKYDGSYQILCPNDYSKILEAESSKELDNIADFLWGVRSF